MRLSDAEKVSHAELLDLLLLETKYGTRGIFAEDLARSLFQLISKDGEISETAREGYFEMLDSFADVNLRRNTFRGKLLGTEVTEEQYAAIADGSFKGLFLGDYWNINGYTWRIADFDYWIRNSDNGTVTDHHLLIFPDEIMSKSVVNTSSDISGGLLITTLIQQTIPLLLTNIIYSAFPKSNILMFKEYTTNGVTNGVPTSTYSSTALCSIPNESSIFGHTTFASTTASNVIAQRSTSLSRQLSILRICPSFIADKNNESYWLSDICNSNCFCAVIDGKPSYHTVTNELGVRIIFGLKGSK